MRAAQGDRLTHMAERGHATPDEVDDMRAADQLCNDVLISHYASSAASDSILALSHWLRKTIDHIAASGRDVKLPDGLRDSLRDIGEELRDSSETELDRLALEHMRRMLRRRKAGPRDAWALHRVLSLVHQDGFIDVWREPHALESLRASIGRTGDSVELNPSITRELRQVIAEFR
jgi:hypothetical protein